MSGSSGSPVSASTTPRWTSGVERTSVSIPVIESHIPDCIVNIASYLSVLKCRVLTCLHTINVFDQGAELTHKKARVRPKADDVQDLRVASLVLL